MKTKPGTPTAQTAQNVPTCWAWHYQRLQDLRDRLLKDRGEELAEAAEPIEPHSMDIADSATDEFDHDLALGILSREQDALLEVDAAIQRILNRSYGICEETGKAIPMARLRAVPWTRYTREVEERLEREGLAGPAHLGRVSPLNTIANISEADEPADEEMLGHQIARHQRESAIREIESGQEPEVPVTKNRP
jgi:RNA polymerase-binding transcription factor DksA